MSYIPFLDDPIPGRQPGGIAEIEKWWVERQEVLERAGYLLRSRYRPDWQPSWAGTNKFYLDVEDGQSIRVTINPLFLRLLILTISAALRNGRNSYL